MSDNKYSEISISPCRQEWNKMKICKDGRFCNSCQLTVIDAGKFSNEELLALKKKNGRLCVRISEARLAPSARLRKIIDLIEKFIQLLSNRNIAAFAGALLFFSLSCRTRRPVGIMVTHQNDRIFDGNERNYLDTTALNQGGVPDSLGNKIPKK
jgi:hypothetical protein